MRVYVKMLITLLANTCKTHINVLLLQRINKQKQNTMDKLILTASLKEALERGDNSVCRALIAYIDGCNDLFTTARVNYIAFRHNTKMLSYLPAGREHILNDDGDWSRKGRQNAKIGAVLRAILVNPETFSNAEIEKFTNYLTAMQDDNSIFTELDSSCISEIYEESGTSEIKEINSCMTDSDYFDLYREANLRILTLRSSTGLLLGRALIWPKVETSKYGTLQFCDRFYTPDHLRTKFREYCNEKGYARKVQDGSYIEKKNWIVNGEVVTVDASVQVDSCRADIFPYIDTFSYGDDSHLTNWENDSTIFTYNNTDGTRDEKEVLGCECCGHQIEHGCEYNTATGIYCKNCVEHDDYNSCYIRTADACYIGDRTVHYNDIAEAAANWGYLWSSHLDCYIHNSEAVKLIDEDGNEDYTLEDSIPEGYVWNEDKDAYIERNENEKEGENENK